MSNICVVEERNKERKAREELRLAEFKRRREHRARLDIMKCAKALVWSDESLPLADTEGGEPTIDIGGMYQLGDASLTVNVHGALCLNTPNLFIADIDGDLDDGALLGKYPWLSPLDCIFQSLSVLDTLAGSDFREQSYRVYTTLAGYRIICTSKPIDVNTLSLSLLRFLWSDPRYAVMCERDHNFRARLTPKAHRVLRADGRYLTVPDLQSVYDKIDDWFVCESVGWFRGGVGWYDGANDEVVHPELVEQLQVHDDFCLQVKEDAKQG